MPKMRTIDQAIEWLHSSDPECALTKTALRRLVTTGLFPCVRIGQKYLIDLDMLGEYLKGTSAQETDKSGKIRRVQA